MINVIWLNKLDDICHVHHWIITLLRSKLNQTTFHLFLSITLFCFSCTICSTFISFLVECYLVKKSKHSLTEFIQLLHYFFAVFFSLYIIYIYNVPRYLLLGPAFGFVIVVVFLCVCFLLASVYITICCVNYYFCLVDYVN